MKKRGGNPEPPALPLPLFGGILRKNDEVFSMQPRFRTLKTTIRTRLQEPGWDDFAKELDEVPARELVGPLFSCLPLGGEATDRAAAPRSGKPFPAWPMNILRKPATSSGV